MLYIQYRLYTFFVDLSPNWCVAAAAHACKLFAFRFSRLLLAWPTDRTYISDYRAGLANSPVQSALHLPSIRSDPIRFDPWRCVVELYPIRSRGRSIIGLCKRIHHQPKGYIILIILPANQKDCNLVNSFLNSANVLLVSKKDTLSFKANPQPTNFNRLWWFHFVEI